MQNQQGKTVVSTNNGGNGRPAAGQNNDKKRFSNSKDDSNAEALPHKIQRAPAPQSGRTVVNSAPVNNGGRPATAPSSDRNNNANNGHNNAGNGDGSAPRAEGAKKPRNRNRNKGPRDPSDPTSSSNAPTTSAPAHSNIMAHSAPPGAKGVSGARNVAMDVESDSEAEKPAYLTDMPFTALDIAPNTIKAIVEVMKFKFMTRVQHDSLPEILKGHDALVKAKTGTGKTVGFLVPSIEVLIREKARVRNDRNAPAPRILILSPTRELAQQIAAEATALCTFHNLGITLLVGGTSMGGDVRSLNKVVEGNSDIIVATPGRMVGHLEETNGFSQQMKGVKVFVMDEADRLLDMGFSKDISKITGFLNHREAIHGKRQTLLFSATVSPEIQQIARSTLQHGYKFIDTVGEEVEQTHAHVPQQVVTVPLEQQMRAIVSILEEQKRINADYKMILFFPTARQTGYYAAILNSIGMKVLEIHSRKSQAQRTRTSEEFRAGRNVILLSSDVSARGMDYPDVSFVLQVGMTARDQYIHRLGRTARAGKQGCGLLLLAPFEKRAMMDELNDMPLQEIAPPSMQGTPLMEAATRALISINQKDEGVVSFGEDSERDSAKMAWSAWLGYYNGMIKKLGTTKAGLVELSAFYATSIGLSQIPALPKKTIGKMGMQGVPGLRIESAAEAKPRGDSGRGGGGRGGGGGGAPRANGGGNGGGGGGGGGAPRPQSSGGRGGGGGGAPAGQAGGRPQGGGGGGGRPQGGGGGRGGGGNR